MRLISRMWTFVSKPKNLAVLIAVGSLFGFLLKEFVFSEIKSKASTLPSITQNANAPGGIAVNATDAAQVIVDKSAIQTKLGSKDAVSPLNNDKNVDQNTQILQENAVLNAVGDVQLHINNAAE